MIGGDPLAGDVRALSELIDQQRSTLAQLTTDRQYELHPELDGRYGPGGRAHCLRDAEYHLSYLADAIGASAPSLFADYVAWAKVMLASRGIPAEHLAENLRIMQAALQQAFPPEFAQPAVQAIDAALEGLPKWPVVLPSLFADETSPMRDLARDYLAALLRGERELASSLVLDAARGTPVRDIYLHVFQRSQREIGRLWQMNEMSVAQEHYCTAATQMIMAQLYRYIFSGRKRGRRLVAACIAGDLHELGARMVSDLLEMEGWDTTYLGANVPSSDIPKVLQERNAHILALSVTMTFHLRTLARLIADVRRSAVGPTVRIMVGGYPCNVAPELWRELGADGWARDAVEAISVADRLAAAELSA